MSIFYFIPPKLLYASIVRVCKYWHSIIVLSDFIIGYYRQIVYPHLSLANPNKPCSQNKTSIADKLVLPATSIFEMTTEELEQYPLHLLKKEWSIRNGNTHCKKKEMVEKLYLSVLQDNFIIKNYKDAISRNGNISDNGKKYKNSVLNSRRIIALKIRNMVEKHKHCQNCLQNKTKEKLFVLHLHPYCSKVCTKCLNLLEFREISLEDCILYYGVNEQDIKQKCNLKYACQKTFGQQLNWIAPQEGLFLNEYIASMIHLWKYYHSNFQLLGHVSVTVELTQKVAMRRSAIKVSSMRRAWNDKGQILRALCQRPAAKKSFLHQI
ncbi:hypothetical protein RFI_09250 [Reticulomyxa filosa]|uniref:F-box domain-containing protein n=1 Tax=Reticulomyxa filosa TaxID=46433 RepID=X6NPG7_RETFI|nr:hypothetical protein RFI_09250 [Reticulomyxa filosa]|eukprot:ETO27881.1 hypothetical protein RFI_09250 [Reticulomyxa filosa]